MVFNSPALGKIEAIHVSAGGVPKKPALSANILSDCVEGDGHNDKAHHGGPDRAVSLYALELIEALKLEGHPIFPGSTGENVTVSGLEWARVTPGSRILLGPVELEVTGYASPCKTIRRSFTGEYFNRISQKLFPGWSRVYTRVMRTGAIQVGDPVTLITTIS